MTLLYLALIAYVPGALIYRAPVADRSRRAALPAEERLFWSVMISVITSSTVALALAAIGVYSLERLATCNAVLALLVAVLARGNVRLESSAPRPGWTAALPAGLIVLGAWMFFAVPASEYVIGGRDPGVYVNQGIQIAQRQSLVTRDGVAAAVPASLRNLFFPFYGEPGYHSVRFMGFHLRDPEAGTVSGQFPQGYPIWIAIAYGLDGVTGTRRITAWWAVLGVLAVYFAGTRLTGAVPAAAAAGLLAMHVIQTWYARYPNAEMIAQPLLFAALLAHAYAHEDDDRFFGPIAASLLGLALFTRLPAVIAVGVAIAATPLALVNGHRVRAGFVLTLGAWMGAGLVYYMTQLRPYFNRPITYVQSLQPIHIVGLAAGAAAAAAVLLAIRSPRVAAATRKWLPVALAAAVTLGSVYAFFLRTPGVGMAAHDAYAVRMFANLYFTRTAFALALIGYIVIVWRAFWRAPAMILTITALGFFFFYKMRIWPEHFWLARRFLDVILPAALLFTAAAALMPLANILSQPWASTRVIRAARLVIGLIAVGLIGTQYLGASARIRSHIEYAGLIPRVERLAGRFGNDDLVLVEAREASDVHVLALPLAYIYARNVLVLYESRPDKASVVEFLSWAQGRYRNVYFIAGGGTDLLSPGIGAEVVGSERFQVPEYARTPYDVYPRSSLLKPFDFTIYKLVESSSGTKPTTAIDIGGADDLYLVDFHPKERLSGGSLTFRWTGDSSYLLMTVPPGSHELVLRLAGGRPDRVATPGVTVHLGGRKIGTAEPARDFRDYTFPIPQGTALARPDGLSEIRIESTTWTPRDVLGGSDDRRLGVMIDLAEVR